MKEKFLHNSFFNYMRLLNRGTNANFIYRTKGALNVTFTVISCVLLCLVLSSLKASSDEVFIGGSLGWPMAIYICCLICGFIRGIKPSTLGVAPIGYKKRTLYAYLSSLTYCVLFILFYVAALALMMLFIALIVLSVTGEWVFIAEFNGAIVKQDALGEVFSLFTFVLLFGAGMFISYLKDKKVRVAAMLILPAALEVIALLLINFSSADGEFHLAGDVLNNFQNLPLSWLWLTAYALISAAVCAVSVYFAVKCERPKEF